MRRRLLCVIVTYNSAQTIGECAASLLAAAADVSLSVRVIDNASTDNTASVTRSALAGLRDVDVYENQENVGFARAVNQALRNWHGQDVLLLNPDASLEGSCLTRCFAQLDVDREVGAVAPRLTNPDGTLQLSLVYEPKLSRAVFNLVGVDRVCRRCSPETYPEETYDASGPVEAAMGAVLLIRGAALEATGLLAEWTFMYAEDLDYCVRLRKGGWRVWYEASAQAVHHHNLSGRQRWDEKQRARLTFAARQRFLREHHGRVYAELFKALVVLDTSLRLIARAVRGQRSQVHQSISVLRAVSWRS